MTRGRPDEQVHSFDSSAAKTSTVVQPDDALSSEKFEALFRAEFGALAAFGTLVSGRRELGEELAQEAFERLAARRRGAPIANPRAYLRRAVVNLWKNSLRRAGIEFRVRLLVSRSVAESIEPEQGSSFDVRNAMSALSTMQRACLVLRFFDGYSESEGAAVLGISTSSFKTHTRRGLSKLRVKLGVYGNE